MTTQDQARPSVNKTTDPPDRSPPTETQPDTKPRIKLVDLAALKRLAILLTSLTALLALALNHAVNMPGRSYDGPLPPPTPETEQLAERLRAHVEVLAGDYSGRSTFSPVAYAAAAGYLRTQLADIGLTPTAERFETEANDPCLNIYADLVGTEAPGEIVVIGAHYDALMDQPGADDNASGTAATIELARSLASKGPLPRTVRFVLFANEEPPYFRTEDMGSHRHAIASAERGETVTAMLSLEMLGYYDDSPGSQSYPPPIHLLYPDTGDFIAFVGNLASSSLTRRAVKTFREYADFPSVGGVLPQSIEGVDYSDQRSFWSLGIPAVMVTNTAHNRNPNYHTHADTPDTLDYHRMALVTQGLEHVITDLASGK